jgi:hypothetical protein
MITMTTVEVARTGRKEDTRRKSPCPFAVTTVPNSPPCLLGPPRSIFGIDRHFPKTFVKDRNFPGNPSLALPDRLGFLCACVYSANTRHGAGRRWVQRRMRRGKEEERFGERWKGIL